MMTDNNLVVLLFGMIFGGALGYVTAWRFAKRLEFHGVSLAQWDQPVDLEAPRTVIQER